MPPPGNRHHEHQESSRRTSASPIRRCRKPIRTITRAPGGGSAQRRNERPAVHRSPREARALSTPSGPATAASKASGSILGYAGTSNDRAQATLDCFIAELHRFSEGVTADELSRAKTGLKASTIMQGESTAARAGAIAHDFFMRGRIRTLDEIKAAIDAVTRRSGQCVSEKHKPGPVHDRDGRAEGIENSIENSPQRRRTQIQSGCKLASSALSGRIGFNAPDIPPQSAPQRPRHHRRGSIPIRIPSPPGCSSRPARAMRTLRHQRRLAFPRAHDVQGLEQIHLGRRQPHLR